MSLHEGPISVGLRCYIEKSNSGVGGYFSNKMFAPGLMADCIQRTS